ncbi:MAG: beta-galactosidase [Janthinobacterium lividum]
MATLTRFWPAVLLLLLGASARVASADDNIFPPAPAAASSISFDGRGFLIHGKRTFIASGGMEYARIPRALWRDRLLRLKRAGFNCVEIYTFWNYHEPRPGQFDFSGDKDLDAFLKTAKSLDLYAIVRVGPYVCAEWDSGGYPVWLRFVPGLRVREDNFPFIAALDRYWDKLMPIVAANQINHGGSVILVQLENEDPQGWGRVLPNSYFTHMQSKALSLGLQVPYFFSGLHHGSDPAGDAPWSSAGRQSPWFTTEFWSVWYDHYGQTQADVDTYDRRMWKVLAYGGNGLNFYMFHGGSNFGYTNNDEDDASYNYGAAIGQAGDLRPTYYRFKRAALFARSFESILEDSDNATDTYKSVATDPNVHVTARKSPLGSILFLDNPTDHAIKAQTKEADGSLFPTYTMTLAPGQIAPIVHDFPLLPGVILEHSTPLLGIQTHGTVTTVVTGPVTNISNSMIKHEGNLLTVLDPLDDSITVLSFKAGNRTIRVLTMSTDTSDHTWFVGNDIMIGSDYIGDVATVNNNLQVTAEDRTSLTPPTLLFGIGSEAEATLMPLPPAELPNTPSLSDWQTLSGSLEAVPSYSDTAWKASTDPLPMGADGDSSAYAWYRSTVSVPTAGTYSLRFTDGGDWASAFVNGSHAGSGAITKDIPLLLPAGTSRLTVLTAHYGRPRACYALCRLVWSDLPLARLNLEYFGQQPALFGFG